MAVNRLAASESPRRQPLQNRPVSAGYNHTHLDTWKRCQTFLVHALVVAVVLSSD
jgi:hypothetical protein